MTPIRPTPNRGAGSGSILSGEAISQYPPKSASASDPLHPTPAGRRARAPWVTLTFDLQVPGG